MAETSSGTVYQENRRRYIDRVTRHLVVGGGLLVMMALLLIFFYLLYVVTPLFLSPTIAPGYVAERGTRAPALRIGVSDSGAVGYRIDSQGYGEFMALSSGQTTARVRLTPEPVTLLAASPGERPLYALASPSGEVTLVAPSLPAAGAASPVWRYPLGERALTLTPAAEPLRQLALSAVDDGHVIAAAVTQSGRLIVSDVTPDGARLRAQASVSADPPEQIVLTPDGRQIYTIGGARLTLWQREDDRLTRRATAALPSTGPWRLALLSGGRSLLVYAAQRKIYQWFEVPTGQGMRLTEIRAFPHDDTRAMLLATEAQRRVFATLTPEGELSLFASKRQGALLTQRLARQAQQLAFSASGNALLVETQHAWHVYRVDNPYPDIGWRGLWQKIWYENYPQPDYVWQSTSADDRYQAKFSLAPLLIGTLKAAVYAMLFATPLALALAAAIYTACFMTPGLRRWVKPTLEIMGALPTVVVGLVAALWLAPHVETYLSAILALPLLCTLAVLGWGALMARLPDGARRLSGWEVPLMMPVMLATIAAACWLGPRAEVWLLGQPLYQWLGANFAQRNALVAGIALGFALIPLIFSLAEDALFSVSLRLSQGSLALGATPWQTLWHVVLPSASAGIFAALMLSFGRAAGETMIVLMTTGNTPIMDKGLLQGLRSLAANIAIEMPEAVTQGGHYRVLFLTALVLFVFTFVVNTLAEILRQHLRQRYGDEGEQA